MAAPALIWAMSENRVIGRDGDLPWSLPDDMRWFSRHTAGKPVIMGRKTFESMPSALSGRRNMVISRNSEFSPSGAEVFDSLEAAYKALDDEDEPMVIGGSQVYRSALEATGRFAPGRLYRTLVEAEIEGDTYFPDLCMQGWRRVFCESHDADARHVFSFTFEIFERA